MSGYTILLLTKYQKSRYELQWNTMVTCQLDEQQMSSLLYERDDLSAIDFHCS